MSQSTVTPSPPTSHVCTSYVGKKVVYQAPATLKGYIYTYPPWYTAWKIILKNIAFRLLLVIGTIENQDTSSLDFYIFIGKGASSNEKGILRLHENHLLQGFYDVSRDEYQQYSIPWSLILEYCFFRIFYVCYQIIC